MFKLRSALLWLLGLVSVAWGQQSCPTGTTPIQAGTTYLNVSGQLVLSNGICLNTTTGAVSLPGGAGGGNTTSSALVTGNVTIATGPNAIGDGGFQFSQLATMAATTTAGYVITGGTTGTKTLSTTAVPITALAQQSGSFTVGDCLKVGTYASGYLTISDQGAACGSGTGGLPSGTSIIGVSSGTGVNVTLGADSALTYIGNQLAANPSVLSYQANAETLTGQKTFSQQITSPGCLGCNDLSDSAMGTFASQKNSVQTNLVSTPTRVALIGDSYTEGAGYASIWNIWALQLQKHLQTMYGNGGTGSIAIANSLGAWNVSAGCTTITGLGPYQTTGTAFSTLYQCTGNTNTATFGYTNKFYGNSLVIHYATYTDSGSGFTVSVDGGGAVTYGAATSGTYTPQSATISLTAGYHSAVITFPATGNCYLYSAEFQNTSTTQPGIIVDNYGHGGAMSTAFGGSASTQLAFVQPYQLAIIMLGVNDYANNITPSTYQTNLQALITAIQTASPAASILIVDQANVTGTYTYAQSQYRTIEQNLAITNANCTYLSIAERWGTLANAQALGLMYSDNFHPDDKGHRDIDMMIESRILPGGDNFSRNFVLNDSGSQNLIIGQNPALFALAPYEQTVSKSVVVSSGGGWGNVTTNATGPVTAFGWKPLNSLTTGTGDDAFGSYACPSLTTQSNDICIGDNSDIAGASGAMQMGSGQNTTANSLQFKTVNFLNSVGHILPTSSAPALSTCGTSPTLATGSSDTAGEVTVGTSGTGCTLTFATAFGTGPFCTVSSHTSAITAYSESVSALTVTGTGTFDYHCSGK